MISDLVGDGVDLNSDVLAPESGQDVWVFGGGVTMPDTRRVQQHGIEQVGVHSRPLPI